MFPGVREVAFSNTITTVPGSERLDTLHMAFINAPGGLTASDRNKLREYLELRLKEKDVHLAVNPAGFPWPKAEEKMKEATTSEAAEDN